MATGKKVALITGGNRRIGLETARGLAALGYAVALGRRDVDHCGRKAAEELRAGGAEDVAVFRCDVADVVNHEMLHRSLRDRYGKLDALVNNAGIMVDPGGDFHPPRRRPLPPRRTGPLVSRRRAAARAFS